MYILSTRYEPEEQWLCKPSPDIWPSGLSENMGMAAILVM